MGIKVKGIDQTIAKLNRMLVTLKAYASSGLCTWHPNRFLSQLL